jgi:hypothetical protein
MSALPPKADIVGRQLDVSFVPLGDIDRHCQELAQRVARKLNDLLVGSILSSARATRVPDDEVSTA